MVFPSIVARTIQIAFGILAAENAQFERFICACARNIHETSAEKKRKKIIAYRLFYLRGHRIKKVSWKIASRSHSFVNDANLSLSLHD